MTAPTFVEISPGTDCDCAGCLVERIGGRRRDGTNSGTAAAHRRAAALAVLGGVSLTGLATAQAPEAQAAPQTATASAQNVLTTYSLARASSITRTEILQRAQNWVNQGVPYSMYSYWRDGYRQDCSGFISMAWKLGSNQWTGSLSSHAVRIAKSELKPGDILLFHNPSNPGAGSHVTMFAGWANSARTSYLGYEQTRPKTVKRTIPYAYYSNSGSYVAYRYKNVVEDGASTAPGNGNSGSSAFPGSSAFGPGKSNAHITRLGNMLSSRGGAGFYPRGTGPTWTDDDRRATQAFQKAQGWTGSDANGIPGPETWRRLVNGTGKNIPAGNGGGSSSGNGSSSSSAFPGSSYFGPGKSNAHITKLGKLLVKKGYGRYYTRGPGPSWGEADRRNVEAFQRAQGWTGRNADGYPGPETWRRLNS
ncbi:peptidoglycan-binding protein [Streptomyces sp. NPDC056149]|uniref:peptidoglycan-binding protein n=1 Tax=unclassified Streptomyces TaxID=2593676 RepID=UPI0023814278|nr:peptidoglycan-binding protein [Streptomyces sp. WZ-12]